MNPIIEPAEEADIPYLLPLLEQLFSLEEDFVFSESRARAGLHRLIPANNHACVMVARCERDVIGMCSAQLVMSTAEGALSAWVEDVVVDRHWRGQGVGRKILEAVSDWCRDRGATRMQLLVDKNNSAAREFYAVSSWKGTALLALRKALN